MYLSTHAYGLTFSSAELKSRQSKIFLGQSTASHSLIAMGRSPVTRNGLTRKNEKLSASTLADILSKVSATADITTLTLCNATLTPLLAVQVADFLEKNTTLTHLDLSDNEEIGAHGVRCLASSLLRNRTLRRLTLAGCGLDDDAIVQWTQAWREDEAFQNTTLAYLE